MRGSAFMARCPLEIGDAVMCSIDGKVHEVEDILAIHSLRDGTVRFEYLLDNFADGVEVTVKLEALAYRIADGKMIPLGAEQSHVEEAEL